MVSRRLSGRASSLKRSPATSRTSTFSCSQYPATRATALRRSSVRSMRTSRSPRCQSAVCRIFITPVLCRGSWLCKRSVGSTDCRRGDKEKRRRGDKEKRRQGEEETEGTRSVLPFSLSPLLTLPHPHRRRGDRVRRSVPHVRASAAGQPRDALHRHVVVAQDLAAEPHPG